MLPEERRSYCAFAALPMPVMCLWPHIPHARWWHESQGLRVQGRVPELSSSVTSSCRVMGSCAKALQGGGLAKILLLVH